jgi:hypothetical protein
MSTYSLFACASVVLAFSTAKGRASLLLNNQMRYRFVFSTALPSEGCFIFRM